MQISQPPPEIYALIIELAGVHAYHHLDINTLLSLCYVSKLFHALTTPILYSSIELPSFNAIRKLEQVRKANPRLLHHIRAIFFTSDIPAVWLAQTISIVQEATGLQRLYIIGTFPGAGAFCRLDGPGSLFEFAALHSSPFANDPNFTFPFRGLRRLALETVDFRNSRMLAALLELCNLTHLAVVRLDVKQVLGIQSTGAVVQDGVTRRSANLFVCNLAKYITEAVSEPRIIFGMRGDSSSHRETLIREVGSLTPLAHRVVFALYSIGVEGKDWFRHMILDGSLWDMEY
jgi:hypothetical protein